MSSCCWFAFFLELLRGRTRFVHLSGEGHVTAGRVRAQRGGVHRYRATADVAPGVLPRVAVLFSCLNTTEHWRVLERPYVAVDLKTASARLHRMHSPERTVGLRSPPTASASYLAGTLLLLSYVSEILYSSVGADETFLLIPVAPQFRGRVCHSHTFRLNSVTSST